MPYAQREPISGSALFGEMPRPEAITKRRRSPLHRGAFRRSFVRDRTGVPRQAQNRFDCGDADEHWYEYWYEVDFDEHEVTATVGQYRKIREFLERLRSKGGTRWFGIDSSIDRPDERPPVCEERIAERGAPIEERLFEHLGDLLGRPAESTMLRLEFELAPFSVDDADVVDPHEPRSHFRDMLAAFLPFWIRSPATYRGPAQHAGILAHVFGREPADMPIFASAFEQTDWLDLKPFLWLILMGSRASLRRAADLFNWKIPNKLQYLLETTPPIDIETAAALSMPQLAILHADAIRLGGNIDDIRRLLRIAKFAFDPTNHAANERTVELWSESIRWFGSNRGRITDENADLILQWFEHVLIEEERVYPPTPRFSWKGRTIDSVIAAARRYQQSIERPAWFVARHWPALGLSAKFEIPRPVEQGRANEAMSPAENDVWRFIELTTSAALYDEGVALRHCVGSYAGRCASGLSAIVSLRRNDQRRVTVEVCPRTLTVVQARGNANRVADNFESSLIARWMREVVIPRLK